MEEKEFDGAVAEDAKDSADSTRVIDEEQVDHSQSIPGKDDDSGDGPSVADAFRSGS